MNKEQAIEFDSQDRPLEAAEAYEQIIAQPNADIESFINLAVLYFVCTDGGYAAYHRLSNEFVNKAWERANEVLDKAEAKFGKYAEIDFWCYFFRFIVLGEGPFIHECRALATKSTSIVPYFHLFALSGGEQYREKADQLLELVKGGKTAKNRYIKSVLESKLKKNREKKGIQLTG